MGKRINTQSLILLIVILCANSLFADTVHVLTPGETLYSLSRAYKINVNVLMKANGISNPSSLSVGTRLTIPGEKKNKVSDSYTVVRGDTYYSIARKHEMSVNKLLSINSRNSDSLLKVGEKISVFSKMATRPLEESSLTTIPTRVESLSIKGEIVKGSPQWPVTGQKQKLEGKLSGVSIQTTSLSYVYAVASGDVVWTGPYRGFGNVVLVDSSGYIYLYGGNEDLFVNVGQPVVAGNRIGRLGASIAEDRAQTMIFSVFKDGVPVSPEEAPRG